MFVYHNVLSSAVVLAMESTFVQLNAYVCRWINMMSMLYQNILLLTSSRLRGTASPLNGRLESL